MISSPSFISMKTVDSFFTSQLVKLYGPEESITNLYLPVDSPSFSISTECTKAELARQILYLNPFKALGRVSASFPLTDFSRFQTKGISNLPPSTGI